MRFLIGVDDTDNLESRGTGFRARNLGAELTERGLGRLRGVSRHQLYVHDDIAYTSHNSSLCLDVEEVGDLDSLTAYCRDFLLRESAPGSDAGLCIAAWDAVPADVISYGRSAKDTVLTRDSAVAQAAAADVFLEGLTGDHGGMIGALSAVGLRRSGADGRFVWLQGVRELSGVARTASLLAETGIEVIRSRTGDVPGAEELIKVDPWPRAVLLDGQAVLLVEKPEQDNVGHDWQLLAREVIRQY